MASGNGTGAQDLRSLLSAISDEVDKERLGAMPPDDQRLDEVAREILRLERDLTVPGSPSSESVRIERLMNFIEGREF